MAESEGTDKLIPAEETEMSELQRPTNLDEEFNERKLDEDFWSKVCTENECIGHVLFLSFCSAWHREHFYVM